MSIAVWHTRLLEAALEQNRRDPTFRFNMRTVDKGGRLNAGYWFTGNDHYIFFAPFKPHDQNNKTRTIGFVVGFEDGEPERSYLEVVFGATRDPGRRRAYEDIVAKLGPFKKVSKDKYQRTYESLDPLESFRQFLDMDHPKLREIIKRHDLESEFLVGVTEFTEMLDRVRQTQRSIKAGPALGVTDPKSTPTSAVGTPRNLILYGPPGTGKTYWMRAKFAEYTDSAQAVDKGTWLQELMAQFGWRPVIAAALESMKPKVRVPEINEHEWVRAKAMQRGRTTYSVIPTIWAYLQQHTPESVQTVRTSDRRAPFIFTKGESGDWSLLPDWRDQDGESAELSRLLKAGPGGSGEEVRRYRVVTFHPSFGYEDFVRGIRPVATEEDGTTQFRLVDGVFKHICDEARANPGKRYALFIDEINRANVAKVFGELITLIEHDKRASFDSSGRPESGMTVQLPGTDPESGEAPFGVPANLDLYGTMNTADRSIALLDVALRRRFEFQEMEPDYGLLNMEPGGVHLGRFLRRLNDRLEFLLDRDHRIGHAYLMKARSLEDLQLAMAKQIVPLLQEYFFDDPSRMARVLTTSPQAPPFIEGEALTPSMLFPGPNGETGEDLTVWRLTPYFTWTAASFVGVYETVGERKAEATEA